MNKKANIQNEIELSIVLNHISRKSDMTILSEIAFINKCLSIKEKNNFLSTVFFDALNNDLYDNYNVDILKKSLISFKKLLWVEFQKRHIN